MVMFRRVLLAIFILANIISAPAHATQNKISTSFEIGERSITDTIDDRDLSGNYDYYRYRLAYSHTYPEDVDVDVGFETYKKDYVTSDASDNWYHAQRVGLTAPLGRATKPGRFRLALDGGYKDKEYGNSPALEYRRSFVSLELGGSSDELWAWHWKNGFINYAFEEIGSDQLKLHTKISGWRKFFDKRLKINPSYRFQHIEQDDEKERTETVGALAASYNLALPYFKDIGASYEKGRNDTKDSDYEDRDDDLRFRYAEWNIETGHPLTQRCVTGFTYGREYRDYVNSANDYRNYFIGNRLNVDLSSDEATKVDISLETQHKEAAFHAVGSLNYIKNLVKGELCWSVKDDWELRPGFKFTKYDYNDNPVRDERQYETKVEYLKKLLSKSLDLRIAFKYVWKDYARQPDVTLWSVRAGMDYRF